MSAPAVLATANIAKVKKSAVKIKRNRTKNEKSEEKGDKPTSVFASGTFNDIVLSSFCKTAFAKIPATLEEVLLELKTAYGWTLKDMHPRSTADPVALECDDVVSIDMPASVVCPRFDEYNLVGEDFDVMNFIEPEFLRKADTQFVANLHPTDVVESLGVDFVRKQNTFYVLDTMLAHFASLNIKPNLIHHCDASYLPRLLQRFNGRGVGTVVFLHPKGNKMHEIVANAELDDMEPVDYNYVFHHGSIADFVHFVDNQALYNATVDALLQSDLINDPEFRSVLESVDQKNASYAEIFGLRPPGFVPSKYHLYFGMHDYELVRTRAINDLAKILHPDLGVGILTLVSPSVLFNPVVAALGGYNILATEGDRVDLFDTYTSRKFNEFVLDMRVVSSYFEDAGAVFGLATSSFYKGVDLAPGCNFDQSMRVYGFHFNKPNSFPLPQEDWFSGSFKWDEIIHKPGPQVVFNNPTQASLWDVMHMTDCVYAPKSNGYTGILILNAEYVDLVFGPYTMRKYNCNLPHDFNQVAFQVELLLNDNDGKLVEAFVPIEFPVIQYVVLDMLGLGNRSVPFYAKWECVKKYFANNMGCLQNYSSEWNSSAEGCVIQPILHVSTDVVRTPTGKETRSHAKSVKHTTFRGDLVDSVDFCVPLLHTIATGVDHTLNFWEVEVFSHLGRFHIRILRQRPDRVRESLTKVPNNLASFSQFQHVVENSLTRHSPPTVPVRYAIYKFKRIIHALLVESFQGRHIDGREWDQLLVWKGMARCHHGEFNPRCYPCAWMQEAVRVYPQIELSKTVRQSNGFIFKNVRDLYFRNAPVPNLKDAEEMLLDDPDNDVGAVDF
jgi:hypothetical protein